MKRVICSLLLLISIITTLQARDTITVATEIWPPFRIKEGGELRGFDIDLMNEVAKEMNLVVKYVQAPWVRCLYMMEHGQADLMVGLAYTEERARYTSFTKTPYYECHPAFYVRKGQAGKVKSYNDLKKISIGYTRSSYYFEPFNSDSTLKKVDLTDESSLLKMVLHKRVDAIVGTDCQVAYEIALLGLTDSLEQADYQPESTTRLYYGVSKKSTFHKRYEELNRVMNQLIAKKRPAALANRYFR